MTTTVLLLPPDRQLTSMVNFLRTSGRGEQGEESQISKRKELN